MNVLISYCFADVLMFLPFKTILRILLLNKALRILFLIRYANTLTSRKNNLFKEVLLSLGVARTVRSL